MIAENGTLARPWFGDDVTCSDSDSGPNKPLAGATR